MLFRSMRTAKSRIGDRLVTEKDGTAWVWVSLYLLMNLIYLGVLPLNEIQTAPQDIVAAQTIGSIFGNTGRDIIAVIIMISAFGCANGMILTGCAYTIKWLKTEHFSDLSH